MIKTIQGERLDYEERRQNCAGCLNRFGDVCSHYDALLRLSPHRPNECVHWVKLIKEEV